jgi:hypothetical protein
METEMNTLFAMKSNKTQKPFIIPQSIRFQKNETVRWFKENFGEREYKQILRDKSMEVVKVQVSEVEQ